MSEEGSFGLSLAERFFGFILMIIGVVTLYYTVTSTQALLAFTGLFAFLSLILVVLGFVLMIAMVE